MTSDLIVVEHEPHVPLASFAQVLENRRTELPWKVCRPLDAAGDGDPFPAVDTVAGALVLGGTMGVPDRDDHPWMAGELAWLQQLVEADVPVLGVCLGCQLLAHALGGEVSRRETPEVGYLALDRTDDGREDEVVSGWPDGTAILFIHEDEVIRLPDGAAQLLEGSDGIPAWRRGSALAVQFHPEATHELLAEWAERERLHKLVERAGLSLPALLEESQRRQRFSVAVGRALVGRWLDAEVLPRTRA